jgi:hypothetical protein
VDPKASDICSMNDAIPFIHLFVNQAALEVSHWVETQEKRNFIVTGKNRVKWL